MLVINVAECLARFGWYSDREAFVGGSKCSPGRANGCGRSLHQQRTHRTYLAGS